MRASPLANVISQQSSVGSASVPARERYQSSVISNSVTTEFYPARRAGRLASRSEASDTLELHSENYYSDANVNDIISNQLSAINPYFLHSH